MDSERTGGLAKSGQMHDHKYVSQPREDTCDMLADFKPFYLISRDRIRPFVAFLFHGNAICV